MKIKISLLMAGIFFASTIFKVNAMPWSIRNLAYNNGANINHHSNAFWEARTIKGRITDLNGNPVQGAKIRAFDEDAGEDDFMAENRTNLNGDFIITYRKHKWDPFPDGMAQKRPDIYINVLINVNNQWVRVGASKTHEDWKLADLLVINYQLTESNSWKTVGTTFDPVIHSFPFDNEKRKVCAAPTCKQENWAGQYMNNVLVFNWALCGGMSLSALRRFKNGNPVDTFSPTLKQELVKAQIETLGTLNWGAFIIHQGRPTLPHPTSPHTIGNITKENWVHLYRRLQAGKPTILGLIRIQSTNPLRVGENHQVLAIGYRCNDLTGEVEIKVYDPNYHQKVSTIYLNIRIPNNQIHAIQKTPGEADQSVRGFFVLLTPSGNPGLE